VQSDTAIDVKVPNGALIGPLTVQNALGTGTWVRPFIPARLNHGLPLAPDEIAACVETATQNAFAAQVGIHRLTALHLVRGGDGGPTCEVGLFDYVDHAVLEATVNFQTGAVLQSRSAPRVNPPLGLTEEMDARALAETGALAAKLTANPNFNHEPLAIAGTGTCGAHRCVQIEYSVLDPAQSATQANSDPPNASFSWQPWRIIAVTTVDLTNQVVVSTEVF
jgi:hypothetical protein